MPETWVDRIAKKQTDYQIELEKLRLKYERDQQPPAEFPRGFGGSDFEKFESLFPEMREFEKTQHPEVSPEMAFQPEYLGRETFLRGKGQPLYNPFRQLVRPPEEAPEEPFPMSARVTEQRPFMDLPEGEFEEVMTSAGPEIRRITPSKFAPEEERGYWGKQPEPPEFIEPIARKVSEIAIGAAEEPLFSVGGVNISAGDIVAAALIGYGVYQGITVVGQAAQRAMEKFPVGLTQGIDKWIATVGRNPEGQSRLARILVGNRTKVIERATDNLKRNLAEASAKRQGYQSVTQKTVQDTIKDIEAMPEFTGTRTALTVSGIRAGKFAERPIPSVGAVQAARAELKPEGFTPEQHQQATNYIYRIRNAIKKDYARKYYMYLKGQSSEPATPPRDKLSYMASQGVRLELDSILTKVVTEPALPTPEVGMPEAGLQPSMLPEEIAAREVRPVGKGEVTQISMEDQLKLEQVRRAAEEAPVDVRGAYEAQAQLEGLKVTLENDPVAQHRVLIGKRKVGKGEKAKMVNDYRGLDFFISLREQNFPEYFTLKQARMIKPHGNFRVWSQLGTREYNRVPKDAVLDELGEMWGMTPDEIAGRVMAIRGERGRIKELQADIKRQMTEKALVPRTELTTTEVTENWETLGQPRFTMKQADALNVVFADYINQPGVMTAWELTRELRRETRAGRAESLKARAQELYVSERLTSEEAMKQAIAETMSGELPILRTQYLEAFTEDMREALFAKVYHVLKNEPFEMMSTVTALTNALTGKPIPREPGVMGGSAYTRLQRVFNDQPKVLKAIDKMATEKKPLEDVAEGIFHEIGREPIPIDQETAEYLRKLSNIPQGYRTLLEPDFAYPTVSDLRTTADLEFAKAEVELGQQFAEGKITFDEFQLKRMEARDKSFPTPPIPPYEPPIQVAIDQMPMFPRPAMDKVVSVLKEIGMFPVDIGNFLRANKASVDFSFWRQQAPLIVAHPSSFVQANIEAWNALWSQKANEASWQRITRDPLYEIYAECERQGGDFLRPVILPSGTAQYKGTEEYGYYKGVERVIPRLTGKLPWIKLSARAFETGTNVHNWLIFKGYHGAMLKLSEQYATGQKKLKPGEAFDITKEMVDFSKMLANFSGRGSLGKFKATAPELSALFFAPRYAIGRLLSPKHLIDPNPRVRRAAWKNAATFVSVLGGIVLLGAQMGWWEVEKDPRSAEYMSIRIGNVRIDPWGGFRQFLVFFTRAINGTGVSSVTGAEYEADPLSLIQTFIRGKAAPLASLILDFWRGKNFVGEEVDVANKKQWAERVAPFAVWDIYEAWIENQRTALEVAIPAIVGAGVQTYTGDWRENFTKLGLPKYSENLAYGLTEPYYDTADFWADTAKQFKDVDPATLTEKKGYPPYIKAIAEARLVKEHLQTLPAVKLTTINADPSKGLTFVEYYRQWKEREKLVAAGDEAVLTHRELQPDGKYKEVTYKGEDAVKAFDSDERTRNANRGNFSQIQFAFLMEYHTITDKKAKKEFLEKHESEIGIDPRDEYLRLNPKENALLAIWGQAEIMTADAYKEFMRLRDEFDIPDNAIPEKSLPELTIPPLKPSAPSKTGELTNPFRE